VPRRPADFDLANAATSPGFTPRATDLRPLLELLAGDERTARDAERALARLGDTAARAAMAEFDAARPPLRSRLCALVGRVAVTHADPALDDFLDACLRDEDNKTQRAAIVALGKSRRRLSSLLGLWDLEIAIEERRALARALGNAADSRAQTRLERLETADVELQRIASEARLKLARSASSSVGGEIDLDAALPEAVGVVLHCRDGLEQFVVDELPSELEAHVVGPGRVAASLAGTLRTLLESRTALGFGVPLASLPRTRDDRDLGRTVSAVIASEHTLRLLRTWTRGEPRYRIEWASAGRRRGLTHRVADSVRVARPELVNDPRAGAWQIVVEERARRVMVELRPGRFVDPRFTYRRRVLPAASHPTIAAALARVAGVDAADVVWDPFLGTASELIERARLGPYRALIGSDLDPEALAAARENLDAAGVAAELVAADARSFQPAPPPSLVLTNPPLGRRMLREQGAAELLVETLGHLPSVIARGARLVWISPLPELTQARARRAGFEVELRQRVDMGGFHAEIQRFSLRG
jgi:23S rRNA G2445 N2-methylase RlmL